MTKLEKKTDESELKLPDEGDNCSGSVYQVGGHRLIDTKPVFTSDSKYLLICSGNQLRRYVVETGAFITSHNFGHKNHLISVQLMPNNSDEVMVASNDGLVVVWNLSENQKSKEYKLNINTNVETMNWFQLVSNYFYYTTIGRKKESTEKVAKSKIFFTKVTTKQHIKQKQSIDSSVEVNPNNNSVTFGPSCDPKFCAIISNNRLHVYGIPIELSSKKRLHFMKDDLSFTCIISHPTDEVLATGDSLGRITIWHNFIDSNYPARSVLHWHQWPVTDLCFSPEGTSLYSVGSESVLIRWNLTTNHFGQKNFMPRLGMPIKYVSIDSNLHMIVTSHEDNSIQIFEPQMKGIKCIIEGLTFGNELSAGLLWNRKMKSIVMNGKVGHIQFYSPEFQKQLFQLDIVGQNLVSSSRETKVYPTEVTKSAVSPDGVWLSTVEMRDDFETLPEIRLKFWELNQMLKNYFLNTTIHLPHNSEINCLEFSSDSEAMVSTSTDREFKIWHLVEDDDKKWWKCFKVGNLNTVSIPTIAKWSSDSSLLSIAFDNFITLWDVFDKTVLKLMTKLSVEEKSDSKLIFIDFGVEHKSHYLMEGRHYSLKVWNLLNLSVVWTLQTSETISCISFNKWENKIAVISDKMITFFNIDSDQKIGTVSTKSNQRFIASLFTDETPLPIESESDPILIKSKFYCLNERQELFVFGENENHFNTSEIMEWSSDEILSPMALMLINKKERKTNVKSDELNSYFKTNKSITKLVNDMFLNVPSHVLPPIDILSKTFLQSLNSCREKEDIKEVNDFKSPNNLDIKPLMSMSFDSQSDIQSTSTNLDTIERENETKDMNNDYDIDNQNDFVEEDYSWLKSLKVKDK